MWQQRVMRRCSPLCFSDEEIPKRNDPVSKALRSESAKMKDLTKTGVDGQQLHNFPTLLNHLSTLTRNTVVFTKGATIEKLSIPTSTQRRAFELIGAPFQLFFG